MSQTTKEIKKIGIDKLWSKKTLQKLYIIPIISKCRATCGTSYRYRKQGALGRKPNQTHVLVYTNKPSPFLMFSCSYVLKIHQVSLVLMFLCLKYKPCPYVLLSLIYPVLFSLCPLVLKMFCWLCWFYPRLSVTLHQITMLHHYGKSSSMVGRLLVAANATISEETRRCEIGILTPGCGIGYRATYTTQDLARADACARTARHPIAATFVEQLCRQHKTSRT